VPAALAPRLWPAHLLAAVMVLTTILLGLWQLDAWQERREAEARDLTHATPEPLSDVMGGDDPFPGQSVGQPVDVSGTWVPAGTVYVEGREHDGQDGYWMVTPLAVGTPDGSAIPVVLGWVASPEAAPAAPEGAGDLTGWLQPPESSGGPDPDATDDILPRLRIADVVQHVDQDLYSGYVVAEGGQLGLPEGDLAQLPETSRFTAIRNFLYGIEWFVFGAFVVLMWWRYVQEQTRVPQPTDEDEPDEEPAADQDQPDTVST
jgi:surfeit locus 1 family protein